MMPSCRRLILVLALLVADTVADDGRPRFDLADASPDTVTVLPVDAPAPRHAAVTRVDQSWRFELEGPAGCRRRWFIPWPAAMRARWQARFAVEAANLSGTAGPVVAARLAATGMPPEDAPLFIPIGSDDRELGSSRFTTADGPRRLAGFVITLTPRRDGPASLLLHRLDVTPESNLPDADAVRNALRTPPPLTATADIAVITTTHDRDTTPVTHRGPACLLPTDRDAAKALADAGVTLFTLRLPVAPLWITPQLIDFDAIDTAIAPLPDNTFLMLELECAPPRWWPPDQPHHDYSQAWRNHIDRSLGLILQRIRDRDAARPVIGLQLLLGPAADNRPDPSRTRHPDYALAFRSWLRRRYPDRGALRQAWQAPDADFDTASPLPPDRWRRGLVHPLVHPAVQRRRTDSAAFYNHSWAQHLLHWAARIKALSGRRTLTGITDGPLRLLDEPDDGFRITHDALAAIIAHPDVDTLTITCPIHAWLAADPTAPTGPGPEMLLAAPARRHRKALLLRYPAPPAPHHTPTARAAQPLSRQAIRLGTGAALWADAIPCFPFAHDRTPTPNRLRDLRDTVAILRADRRRPTDTVLAVVAPDLSRHITADPFAQTVTAAAIRAWFRSGVPVAFDFPAAIQSNRSRCVHILAVPHLPEPLQATVTARRHQSDILWTWPSGIVGTDYLSPADAADCSGFHLRQHPTPAAHALHALPAWHRFLASDASPAPAAPAAPADRPQPNGLAGRGLLAPKLAIADPDATPLAVWQDGGIAIASKRRYGRLRLFAATPALSPDLLRTVADHAGIPAILDSGDLCFVDDTFITIHARTDGPRTIRLPTPERLVAPWHDLELPAAAAHRVGLKAGRTYCFRRTAP